jgi:serine phosphatase RsbU (regulator of sigma subunit)
MDTGEPIMSDEEKTNEQLLAELVELRQQLVVKQAAERVWQEVLAMRESEDIVEVVAVMWQEMKTLMVKTPIISIHFIDEVSGQMILYSTTKNPQQDLGLTIDSPKIVKIDPEFTVIKVNMSIDTAASFHSIDRAEYIRNWKEDKVFSFRKFQDEESMINILEQSYSIKREVFNSERGKAWLNELLGEWYHYWIPFEFGVVSIREKQPNEYDLGIVQELTDALSFSYLRFIEFQKLEEENTRQAKELEEARQLQLSMLPDKTPTHPHMDIAWHMETASEVGGDYYDYTLADNGTLTLTLGDATGHGMAAGVVVTATKSLFQSLGHQPNMVETFMTMSRHLKGMNLQRIGMAMNMVKLKDGAMQVSSAGIPPLLLYRAATGRVEEILIEGMPLGYSARAQYEQQTFELTPGDTVLMMSDGLPERLNPADEEYGYPRVEALFAEVAAATPGEIIQRLTQGGQEWAASRPQDDDITLVVLKVKT